MLAFWILLKLRTLNLLEDPQKDSFNKLKWEVRRVIEALFYKKNFIQFNKKRAITGFNEEKTRMRSLL